MVNDWVKECLFESEIGVCTCTQGQFSFDMKPNEIKTFKLCK